MVTIYFSGTGNTEYVAKLFSEKMKCDCNSIEKNLDFKKVIEENEKICFCYPIYESRMPRIMKEFLEKHIEDLKGKKIVVLCTQLLFSGDGARSFIDLFPENHFEIIYAEHFFMPNNISNIKIFGVKNGDKILKYKDKTNKKMDTVCNNIKNEIIKKRGFNKFSKIMGLTQASASEKIQKKALNSVNVNDDCIKCGLCCKICPIDNLKIENNKVVQKGNCTICYRCVNKCPKKAITVLFDAPVIEQYKGIK